MDGPRLLAVIDGLNRIAGALPHVEDVADEGTSVAMTLTGATGASVSISEPGPARTFTRGDVSEVGSELTMKLEREGSTFGSFNLTKRSDDGFEESEVEAIRLIAAGLTAQLDHALVHEAALAESRVDPLTGVGNRLAFDERLGWELSRASRYSEKMSLGLFEIDDHERLRSRLDPDDMDRLVVEVAEVLMQGRSSDSCFRVSPDRFAIVMPNTSEEGAEIAAIRMAWQVAGLRGGGVVTVTTGVAQNAVPDARLLLVAAEEALRAARIPLSA